MPISARWSPTAHLGRPVEEDAHVTVRSARRAHRRPDRADRAAGRARSPGCSPRASPPTPLRSIGSRRCFRDRLYVELSRRGDPVEQAAEARADRARLCPRSAARRDQPGCLCRGAASTPRMTPCSASPSRAISTATTDALLARSLDEAGRRRCGELFADLPEAIANTLVVARRCAFAAPKRKPILPSIAGDPRPRPSSSAATRASGLRRSGSQLYADLTARREAGARPISTGSISSSTSSSRWASRPIS